MLCICYNYRVRDDENDAQWMPVNRTKKRHGKKLRSNRPEERATTQKEASRQQKERVFVTDDAIFGMNGLETQSENEGVLHY